MSDCWDKIKTRGIRLRVATLVSPAGSRVSDIHIQVSSNVQEVMEQLVEELALLSRHQFQQFTKEQLLQLAAEQEVEVPECILKPALLKLFIEVLELEELWAEGEGREQEECAEQREREERESRERLAHYEVERARACPYGASF